MELNNNCLKTFITIILAFVVFFIFIRPQMPYNEGFSHSVLIKDIEDVENNGKQIEENDNFQGPYARSEEEQLPPQPESENNAPVEMEIDGPLHDKSSIPANYYFLDDGAEGSMSIQHNLCSKSCCSDQYPTPHKLRYDPMVCKNKDQFVPSRVMCANDFQDSGCLCMTKKQANFLSSRGGNSLLSQQ